MTNIELVSVNSLKDIATKNSAVMMAFGLNIDDMNLIKEFVELQAKSYLLTSNKAKAQLTESVVYNLPGCKLIVNRFMINQKGKMVVATVYESSCNNSCYPNNGKVAAKK